MVERPIPWDILPIVVFVHGYCVVRMQHAADDNGAIRSFAIIVWVEQQRHASLTARTKNYGHRGDYITY